MAIVTLIHLKTRDAQGVKETLSFHVAPLAFAAAQAVPTQAHIEALIGALAAPPAGGLPSSNSVYAYSVEIENQLDFGSELGGDGSAATVIAAKARSGIGLTGRLGPNGYEGEEFKIPGLVKANVTFLSSAPNVISTTGTTWDAIRTALHDLGYQFEGGSAYTTAQMLEAATAFNGKRAPQRSK